MTTITWFIVVALLALSPAFRLRIDQRNCEGERYTVVCGVLFQRPETMACVEVK